MREYICSYLVCLSTQPLLLRSDKLVTCSNLTLSREYSVPSNFRPLEAVQFGYMDGPPLLVEMIRMVFVMNIRVMEESESLFAALLTLLIL